MTIYAAGFEGTQPFSDTCAQFNLIATTNLNYTVPGDGATKYKVYFTYNANSNVFVGYNKSITIPSSNTVTNNSNIEYRPAIKYVKGGDVLNFQTPDTIAYVGIALFQLPG